ncbi:Extracellular signal-regulated kinase 1 [Galdieria sulphuraria]|uniref:Mitogen-activated protein kinase n=1 Tax=Galdieria sulphuraria TaxID=130081 RepID=M2XHK9_GALSU|nr:cyclin-dependent serine/threonine protein kinase [Galdieria sulphuraria]EME29572.1 cyclin-dependent serine/threonine protein kinase [Galdieria sulphuraria]GJD12838.1 Extracellular signal-regulated kinase 1 [Galdieria sulphuraria]|eukprot:XP_005706092.1 cyclin-dependent serine/threonine protein kinase [Galdieria sulphuraria]
MERAQPPSPAPFNFAQNKQVFQRGAHKQSEDRQIIEQQAPPTAAGKEFAKTSFDTVRSYLVCGSRFDCPERFKLLRPIGHGAYGIVCSAKDQVTGELAAIKKITKCFDHTTDARRILREVKLLRHFKHENIIGLKQILRPSSFEAFEDVYLVTELMETDLHQIIVSKQSLTEEHFQYFIYQILRALKYVHSADVLHRDLKPSNVLVNGNCDIKICDFGLARSASFNELGGEFMTQYVATRWYRAPEIMLSFRHYDKSVDIWSVGCIFAELLGRRPLFPGKDYMHQLRLIIDVVGTPSDQDIEYIESEKALRFIRSLPRKNPVAWRKLYPDASNLALDLLGRMLQFDPRKRCSVEDALSHPYLSSLHDPTDEPVCPSKFSFEFDSPQVTKEQLKTMMWEEIVRQGQT